MDRQFAADRPNALWVADFTYVPAWDGMAYVETDTRTQLTPCQS